MHTTRLACVGAALAAACTMAAAQETIVKLGVTRYDTHARTSGLQGIGVPAGADATVGDATTLIVTAERMLTDRIGVELVIGVPPKIKARGAGSVAFLGEVLSARNVAPTLILNYHFGASGDTWRPYVGVGVNYTRFAEIRSPLAEDIEMSDSVGPMVQAGVDYRIDGRWGLFASIAAVKVRSDLVAAASTVLTTTIDFRPVVYSAGVSYRF